MPRHGQLVRWGVTVAALTVLVAGCGVTGTDTLSDRPALDGAITAVRIDNDSGAITVTGGTGAPTLERTLRYRGSAPSGPTHRIEGGTLVLGGCGYNCGVDYVLRVPAGLPVSGRTSAGAISLTEVGKVDVETSSGAIELSGTDAVRAHTSNGAITGRGLRGGGIDATTSNGRIELTLAAAQDVRATTSNGAIDLTVPGGGYRVRTETTNGSQDVRVPNDPAGAHTLELVTSNGSVTVAPA